MDSTGAQCEGVNWNEITLDIIQWQAFMGSNIRDRLSYVNYMY